MFKKSIRKNIKKNIGLGIVVLFSPLLSQADHSGGDHRAHHAKVERVVNVTIGPKGFKSEEPLEFKKNEEIILNVKRSTDKTCMKKIKHPKTGALVDLPLNKSVKIRIGSYSKNKEVALLCGMGMKAGVLHIK